MTTNSSDRFVSLSHAGSTSAGKEGSLPRSHEVQGFDAMSVNPIRMGGEGVEGLTVRQVGEFASPVLGVVARKRRVGSGRVEGWAPGRGRGVRGFSATYPVALMFRVVRGPGREHPASVRSSLNPPRDRESDPLRTPVSAPARAALGYPRPFSGRPGPVFGLGPFDGRRPHEA